MHFRPDEIASQPLPNKERTDDRFELLVKFQGVLKTLGFGGVIVLVDRVDEPHLVNGSPEQMRALLWPMLDNKFLKHPGIGFKLLLPIELSYYLDREDRDFYQRARLDKQNMVPSLLWSGEALYDVANARLQACAVNGKSPSLRDLFDPSIGDRRLIDALRTLRVPRHLFKFLYRVFVSHSNAPHRRRPVLADFQRHVRIGPGPVSSGPGGVRPRAGSRLARIAHGRHQPETQARDCKGDRAASPRSRFGLVCFPATHCRCHVCASP